jgi:uncharacterized protein
MTKATAVVLGVSTLVVLGTGVSLGSTLVRGSGVDADVQSFALDRVTLLDGPFKDAKDAAVMSLLTYYEPDRLLAGFRREAGLEPRAPSYEGWEARGIAGHSLGHYLSALALAGAVTGDPRFRATVDHVVAELAAVQEAQGDGYLGAFPNGRAVFENEIARGDIRSQGFDLNGLWVPLYTHHKVFAGLRDAHRLAGNPDALVVATRFADWLYDILMPLTDEQMRQVLRCEYGGMNEVLAQLTEDTGDPRYLALAERFTLDPVMNPLLEGRDSLSGQHANTQIPKMVGLARIHNVTGGRAERRIAEYFWDRVAHHHSYVTGSNSMAEHFGPPDQLSNRLSPTTAETCNVYNMLRLTAELFEWAPSSRHGDFMERAMLNHSLSSQNPETGHVIYFLSLAMGGQKRYDDPHAFTCCVGSGMEHHLLYGRYLYFQQGDRLYVNQFAASELDWSEKGVRIRQETRFPDEASTVLLVSAQRPTELELRVRVPNWAEQGVTVRVNDRVTRVRTLADGYASVRRTWRDGDRVEVEFPFTLRLEAMPDNPNRVAVFHGPLVMAGLLGPLEDPRARDPEYVPVFITGGRPVTEWVRTDGAQNRFRTVGVGTPRDVELMPFFRVRDHRYTVYWDLFTPEGWEAQKAQYQEARQAAERLERRTIAFLQPGEMQPERDHDFRGEHTEAGEVYERKFRHAYSGGWFSFTMPVPADEPVELVATYWGNEANERIFDILVDGERIATQRLLHDVGPRFMEVGHPIPFALTQGKRRVEVRFQAHPGYMAGGVFGLRIARPEAAAQP